MNLFVDAAATRQANEKSSLVNMIAVGAGAGFSGKMAGVKKLIADFQGSTVMATTSKGMHLLAARLKAYIPVPKVDRGQRKRE